MLGALLVVFLAPDSVVAEAEAKAQQALARNKVGEALEHFETALRAAGDTRTKRRLRDLYRKAGWAAPRPLNQAEQLTVGGHIQAEKVRVFAGAAGRLEGAGSLHAAIIVRRAVVEMVGATTDGGKREQQRIRAIIRKLTEKPTKAQEELIAKLKRAKKTGPSILKAARKLLEQRDYKVVVRLCQEVMFGDFDQEVQNDAVALRKEAEEKAVGDVSVSEKEAARKVLTDARFERLDVALSRHFLYVGPQVFVRALKESDRTELDLAYVFQSDLSGQHLTRNGVRVCVYYQETFDFGGGLAGGKLIRIGNRAIRAPIAGMLHFHELGHCIFGRGWLHHGFTEGLADFAAGFTLDVLGQTSNAQNFITNARTQFVRFFLGRDMRYFHIQPYRPSAGFLFSFLPPGEAPFDWAPIRRVFHRMREAQFGAWPEREHQLMRYFGYLMATEYGPEHFDTLKEWGWPVSRADWRHVPREADGLLAALKQGDHLLRGGAIPDAEARFERVLEADPRGPLAARARFGLLRVALRQADPARAEELKRELGILDDYYVLGPFHARRQNQWVVFPPEVRVDLKNPQLRWGYETAKWKKAKVGPSGAVDLRQGQGFGYPENACAFALTYVHVDHGGPARVWTGSDDGHTLYVNGELAEKRATSRGFRFDDDFADVVLRSGWNRILIKVHNGNGPWGFLMRVCGRDGRPLPGLRVSATDLEAKVAPFDPPKTKAFPVVVDGFKSLSSARWRTAVGSFSAQNGRLRPKGTQKLGLWQRFVVDPDKPKDGPANIAWLKAPDLVKADSLELELVVAAAGREGWPSKFGFTIDGEGEGDGQSGHTLVFDRNDKKVRCHWYRYDRLLYLQQGVEVKPAREYKVSLRRLGRKWWVTVNGVAVFDQVDVRRLPASGFGLLTWGAGPEIESVKLTRLEPVR